MLGALEEGGVGRTGHQRGDDDVGLGQLRLQPLGEGLDERLGRVVDRHERARHLRGDGGGDEHPAGVGQHHVVQHELGQVHGAEHVQPDDVQLVVEAVVDERAAPPDARVEAGDGQRAAAGGDRGVEGLHARRPSAGPRRTVRTSAPRPRRSASSASATATSAVTNRSCPRSASCRASSSPIPLEAPVTRARGRSVGARAGHADRLPSPWVSKRRRRSEAGVPPTGVHSRELLSSRTGSSQASYAPPARLGARSSGGRRGTAAVREGCPGRRGGGPGAGRGRPRPRTGVGGSGPPPGPGAPGARRGRTTGSRGARRAPATRQALRLPGGDVERVRRS